MNNVDSFGHCGVWTNCTNWTKLDIIGQFGHNWTLWTELDNLDKIVKLSLFIFGITFLYDSFHAGLRPTLFSRIWTKLDNLDRIEQFGQNWTI